MGPWLLLLLLLLLLEFALWQACAWPAGMPAPQLPPAQVIVHTLASSLLLLLLLLLQVLGWVLAMWEHLGAGARAVVRARPSRHRMPASPAGRPAAPCRSRYPGPHGF